MTVDQRIRDIVEEGGGRAPAARVVAEALGVEGATGELARRLALSAVARVPGLVVEGDEVVARPEPPVTGPAVALALVPAATPTALPPRLAWAPVPESGEVAEHDLQGDRWRAELERLAGRLSGTVVLALTAASARRVVRLASRLAGLEAEEEPRVVALGRVARALGRPIRSAEEAAALVGQPVPEDARRSALVLADLSSFLAEEAGVDPAALGEVAERDRVPDFDFGERSFGRADLLALPDAPGVYLFTDAEGELLYVGKGKSLARRVPSYFAPRVEPRAERIRERSWSLSVERTGTELSALLREHELIRDLAPPLNVQEDVHERRREPSSPVPDLLAVVQASANGGAEVALVDRARGVEILEAVPEDEDGGRLQRSLRDAVALVGSRPVHPSGRAPAAEIALSWLADHGAGASLVELSGDPVADAELVERLVRDPDLAEGRIELRQA